MVGTAEMHGEIVETFCNSIIVCSLDSRDHRPFSSSAEIFHSVILAVLPAFRKRWFAVTWWRSVLSNPWPFLSSQMW